MRNKPRKKSDVVVGVKYELKEVHTYGELPKWYVGMPDDLEYSIKRIAQLESKFYDRGFKIPHPLKIYRLTMKEEVHPIGKKTRKTKREPFSMIAIEIEKI
jgi:hypothetical protein